MSESAKMFGQIVGSGVLLYGSLYAVFGLYRLFTTRKGPSKAEQRLARHWDDGAGL